MTAISSCIVIGVFLAVIRPSVLNPKIYQGVRIEGVDLSGCSQEDAAKLLKIWQEERHNQVMMLKLGERIFKLEATDIDLDFDVQNALAASWNYGRDGSWWQRLKKIRDARDNGYYISVGVMYNEIKLNRLLEEWKNQLDRPARNATISMETGEVVSEQQGYQLDINELRTLILQSFLQSEGTVVNFPLTILEPEVTTNSLMRMNIHELISSYTTAFNQQDINRSTNIKLAASKVNGQIVYPGATFSFNDNVGPRDKSSGFKEAMEIVDGEFVTGVGGGICQLSSTLYNAAILANLYIAERYNHSKALSYVPVGRDATVVFGILDFKFINNTASPLMIAAQVNGDQLMVGIFGQQSLAEKVEIITKNQKTILPVLRKEQDNSLYVGETKLEKEGKAGISVVVIRLVRLKGQTIKQEILSTDCYPAEDTLLKVGTKIPPFANQIP